LGIFRSIREVKKIAMIAILALLSAASPVHAGWYLFAPYVQPTDIYSGHAHPLYNEPWHQESAYDTAAECNKARQTTLTGCNDQVFQYQQWADGTDDHLKKIGGTR
jgi:hypothetical protein